MTEKEITKHIIDNADNIAREIYKGKDVYITKSANGLIVKKIAVQKIQTK